jgi:hypothetical protein
LHVTDPRVGQSASSLPSEVSASFKLEEDIEMGVNKTLPSSVTGEEVVARKYLLVRIIKESLQMSSA